jgi:phosphotransferase system  glucose/maltose/N-acetylglucosamine-specific IIC component
MKQFLIKSTSLTVIVLFIGSVLFLTILKSFYLPVLPFTVLFFYLATNLVHFYLLGVAGKSGSRFTSKYMAVSFIKMFVYLAIAIVYVVLDRENAKPFIAGFLILYIIYTSFEVVEFLKVVRQKN